MSEKSFEELMAENAELRSEVARFNKLMKKKPKKFTSHDLPDVPPPDVRPSSPILTTNRPQPKKGGMLQTHNLPKPPTIEERTQTILMKVGKAKPKGEKA